MRRHDDPNSYYLIGEGFEPTLPDNEELFTAETFSLLGPSDKQGKRDVKREFKFGRMFPRRVVPGEVGTELKGLLTLGQAMNEIPLGNATPDKGDSTIPAGYTYLGQFLTHEITFDKTKDLDTVQIADLNLIEQGRSPSIDLDSLYGLGPTDQEHGAQFYKDHARLKEGRTWKTADSNKIVPYDLPRGATDPNDIKAVIPDPRNDENLAVAQTHLAFMALPQKSILCPLVVFAMLHQHNILGLLGTYEAKPAVGKLRQGDLTRRAPHPSSINPSPNQHDAPTAALYVSFSSP